MYYFFLDLDLFLPSFIFKMISNRRLIFVAGVVR